MAAALHFSAQRHAAPAACTQPGLPSARGQSSDPVSLLYSERDGARACEPSPTPATSEIRLPMAAAPIVDTDSSVPSWNSIKSPARARPARSAPGVLLAAGARQGRWGGADRP